MHPQLVFTVVQRTRGAAWGWEVLDPAGRSVRRFASDQFWQASSCAAEYGALRQLSVLASAAPRESASDGR